MTSASPRASARGRFVPSSSRTWVASSPSPLHHAAVPAADDLVVHGPRVALSVDGDVISTTEEGRDGAAADRAVAKYHSLTLSPIQAVHTHLAQGVDDTAVARHLVVPVEDVEALDAVAPREHRLPGDQRQPPVDGYLGHLFVLNTVRPAPEDCARSHLTQVVGHWLGEQDHVAAGQQFLAAAGGAESRTELVVFHAEERSVALFESKLRSKEFGDTIQELGVECEALLVLFAGLVENAKCKHVVFPSAVHGFVFFREAQTSRFELGQDGFVDGRVGGDQAPGEREVAA